MPSDNTPLTEQHKATAWAWFENLRDQICTAFETLEETLDGPALEKVPGMAPGRFERTAWQRPAQDRGEDSGEEDGENEGGRNEDGGGGVMSVMRGRVFEKVGVNVSTVFGTFAPEFAKQIQGAGDSGGRFWASGVSLVAHLRSPLVPAIHMNTRHIVTGKNWFGGGADITPMFPDSPEAAADAAQLHGALKTACDAADPEYWPRFHKWCDEYFYLPHRGERRGLGGIFFDNLNTGDWDTDFAFTRTVGEAFLDTYPKIVAGRMNEAWTDDQRHHQLIRRGRYAEFNLLYDRGTQFGLKTGGNTEAILMSLPPEVIWP